jgi:outer membrane protein OmpA-like peptidoglycan-associated protein
MWVWLALTAVARADGRVPIKLAYDADHLDLDHHVLQFKPSRAVQTATLRVIGEDGTELGTGSASYDHPSTDWLAISWTQSADARVMKLELRVEAGDGVATNLELIPWSVAIDHEDVSFATDQATIEPGEQTKLDVSLAKIEEIIKRTGRFMKLELYIAGHTDTVGPDAKNLKLSLERARAIGSYFRRKKLAIPIAVAGFGEHVLKVPTPDDTDERANRRADYVLGPAGGAPPFKGPYLKAHADWKALK